LKSQPLRMANGCGVPRVQQTKHKVPCFYSAAGESAASFTELGMTNFWEIPK
jgi:hypothetical protein